MRIGLTGGAATTEKIIEQARQAEATASRPVVRESGRRRPTRRDGSCWAGDDRSSSGRPSSRPTRAIRFSRRIGPRGRERNGTSRPHLGDRPITRDHRPRRPGHVVRPSRTQHRGVRPHPDGTPARRDGRLRRERLVGAQRGRMAPLPHPVPVLLSALGPRLLRVAGEIADGTVLWMAPVRAVGDHIAPRIHAAAQPPGARRHASSPDCPSPCTTTSKKPALRMPPTPRPTRTCPTSPV